MKNFIFVILVFMQYQLQAQVNLKENFRILTHEEFVDLGKRDLTRVNKRPYIFEGSHESGGKLLYYGSSHFYNPDDPMVKDIEDKWIDFNPDIVLWEGGNPDKISEFNLDKTIAIKEMGEPGLIKYLAKKHLVSEKTLEPSPFFVINQLRKTYSDTEIFIHGILTLTEQAKRKGKKNMELDEIVLNAIEKAKKVGFKLKIDTLDQFSNIVESLIKVDDWHDIELDLIAPKPSTFLDRNIVQKIAVESSAIRDEYIINMIVEEVRQGKNVLAIVGASHVIMQEPGLCQFFGIKYKE